MEAILTKCFICDVACVAHDKYLGMNIARTLTMPMANILDKCLRAHIDVDKEIFCVECAKKIEEYDQVVQLSLQIETELYELFHRKVSDGSTCYLLDAEIIADSQSDTIESKDKLDDSTEDDASYTYDGMVVEYLEECDPHLNEPVPSPETVELDTVYLEQKIKSESEATEEPSSSPRRGRTKSKLRPQRQTRAQSQMQAQTTHQTKVKKAQNNQANEQTEIKIYSCKKCQFKTIDYDEYQEHRTEHDSSLRFVCDICGRSYKSKSALTTHISMHSKKSPFECKLCNKTFTQRGALARHMPMHTGEKPHQCDVCGKRFIHYSSFHMHQMIHTGERRKKCTICGLELRSNSHMNRHMRIHTGEKPFECPICGQKFAQRYNMKTHYNTHQGIHRTQPKNHKCILCDVAYARRERLVKHLTLDHNVNDEDCAALMQQGPNGDIAQKIVVDNLKESDSAFKEEILVEFIDEVDGVLLEDDDPV